MAWGGVGWDETGWYGMVWYGMGWGGVWWDGISCSCFHPICYLRRCCSCFFLVVTQILGHIGGYLPPLHHGTFLAFLSREGFSSYVVDSCRNGMGWDRMGWDGME